ncbi:formylmethanofuran dehydrogenase subunit A [Rubinisphaera brasiliensis]|uniref:Formylmethanofuran dehydrogenase, subunit A n=1 Tax=Rubinisphaera brasiliensis (strain ATCC 49424 / DSM 5305 / JCM 21570 / IAM 15109 / NBRC 103401 / IFAM 1448) TaxID=756272 RepID=F0STG8_RUBBR|nr:formylmethanofuran dehydrogenase subunit A [Rubinisphaera brasiliensis]ADY60430.1 formylmethanofuran dehydrogenase, subunit A [Rubinisphaera brasiliensis DSM 5305]
MSRYRLQGGRIYDPANGRDGQVEDLWIDHGAIVAEPASAEREQYVAIDVAGDVVMPGGVDMHCHIAGPKVNHARGFLAGDQGRTRGSSAENGSPIVPNCRATGQLFAGMGYTTAVDAAIPGISARLAHHEFAMTPYLDKAFLALFGNNHYVMEQLREQRQEAVNDYCAWMLGSVHSHGVKIVNPGGVENWKQIHRQSLHDFDTPVGEFGVTPRQIIRGLATAVDYLQLPHPVHIHCNNLGYPGNWQTTLQTMQSLEGRRGHFAHIQFHSYAGDPNDPTSFSSAVKELVDFVSAHEEISVDVGHVTPGEAMTITGDAPFAAHLQRLTGGRWFTSDTEQEASCGIIPGAFKPYRNLVHATQWAIGLEWYLRMPNPWQIAMSSDHPNGGAFVKYPEVIHLLMKRDFREQMLARMPESLRERSALSELDREYSLGEIAVITRAAPARLLGLTSKGQLGVGADADITVYRPTEDITEMFRRPRLVFKAGQRIAHDGELQSATVGKLLAPQIEFDDEHAASRREWFQQTYSLRYGNYRIDPEESPCLLAR